MDVSPYLNSIVSLRNKTEAIIWKTLIIDKIAVKYSNTNKPIYKLVIDNKPISRNNDIYAKFNCITCGIQQEITLNLFMRKVNNNGKYCKACVNKSEEKASKHSLFMKDNSKQIINGTYIKEPLQKKADISLKEHIELSHNDWKDEDDEFKHNYFINHLTIDEFNNIKNKITGINHKKIIDLSQWTYEPVYRIWNQTKYTPMLINNDMKCVEKPYYITFNCENCDNEFCHRDLEIIKNKMKIYCKDCSFTNKIFRIRTMILNNGDKIKWQSIPEKRFIEWCQDNNINIKNGPKIPYIFNDINRIYNVDFELPNIKYLIEIKDNHHWYKTQVESGKQPEKEKCAINWSKEKNYKYVIVFPKTLQRIKEEILAMSCKI